MMEFGKYAKRLVRALDGPLHAIAYAALAVYAIYLKDPVVALWAYGGLALVAAIEVALWAGRSIVARLEHMLHAFTYAMLAGYTLFNALDPLVSGISYAALALTACLHFFLHEDECERS